MKLGWRQKAWIQRTIARLPGQVAHPLYYAIQRRFGALRSPDPFPSLAYASEIAGLASSANGDVRGARALELGTGRRVVVPIGLWLLGASELVTVDLNPYLKEELVLADIRALSSDPARVARTLDVPVESVGDRLSALAEAGSMDHVSSLLNLRYHAPVDIRAAPLTPGLDLFFSVNVLEHVPAVDIASILGHVRTLMAPGGVVAHIVDPSDHFSHDDVSISAINFLQFEEDSWSALAGNRFMYHNRLRTTDYSRLLEDVEARVCAWNPRVDERSLRTLEEGFEVAEAFRSEDFEVLATTRLSFSAVLGGEP